MDIEKVRAIATLRDDGLFQAWLVEIASPLPMELQQRHRRGACLRCPALTLVAFACELGLLSRLNLTVDALLP